MFLWICIFFLPDKKHKRASVGIPVASFFKDLKDHLMRAKLTDVEKTGRLKPCTKGDCHVCGFKCNIGHHRLWFKRFWTKICGEPFKMQTLRRSFRKRKSNKTASIYFSETLLRTRSKCDERLGIHINWTMWRSI